MVSIMDTAYFASRASLSRRRGRNSKGPPEPSTGPFKLGLQGTWEATVPQAHISSHARSYDFGHMHDDREASLYL